MRPGLFDNNSSQLRQAYLNMLPRLRNENDIPDTSLASEHFFDSSVLEELRKGLGLPFCKEEVKASGSRTSGAVLVEFHDISPLPVVERQLFELQTAGYIPVIAHPERYRSVWEKPEIMERLVDLGSVTLLDTAALAGKYGRRSKASARKLLQLGLYDAACSDAHRPEDVSLVEKGMKWIRSEYGPDEINLLFHETPTRLLEGKRPI